MGRKKIIEIKKTIEHASPREMRQLMSAQKERILQLRGKFIERHRSPLIEGLITGIRMEESRMPVDLTIFLRELEEVGRDFFGWFNNKQRDTYLVETRGSNVVLFKYFRKHLRWIEIARREPITANSLFPNLALYGLARIFELVDEQLVNKLTQELLEIMVKVLRRDLGVYLEATVGREMYYAVIYLQNRLVEGKFPDVDTVKVDTLKKFRERFGEETD